ncbi:MAG: hypothetical protein ABI697_01750, partial [Devosia sp.]
MRHGTSILRAVLGVGLGCWMGVSSTVVALAAESVGDEAARATAYAIQLQRSLQAIEDGRQQSPRDRWDPQYIVDTVGVDPAALYAWERGNVAWVPYRGQLRGPVGVLMDRRANSLDMSLLLAKLLTLAGRQVRLAHAHLSNDDVDAAWTNLGAIAATADLPGTEFPDAVLGSSPEMAPPEPAAAAPAPAADAVPSGSLFGDAGAQSGSLFDAAPAEATAPQTTEEAAALYDLDADAGNSTLTAVSDVRESAVDQLQSRVASQGSRLLSLFAPADGQADYELARDGLALADHWWVQVSEGGNWVDYDLLAPDAVPGKALAAAEATMDPDKVPVEDRQQVQVRLVAEQLIGGKLQDNPILEHVFDPSAVIGQPIKLRNLPMLWPGNWDAVTPDDVQEKLFAALYTQNEWMPMLVVGDDSFRNTSILDTGAINPNPDPQSNPFLSLAFPAAGKVGRITDLFGSMLDEAAGLDGDTATAPVEPAAEGTPRPEGELTSEWLEYTILVPGEKPKVERRVLFDILGDAMRQSGDFSSFRVDEPRRLARAAGEMTTTEIVILPAWPASEFIADLAAQMALANKPVLDLFAKDPFGKAPPNSVELFSKMSDISGPAYLYSMLRSQSSRTNETVFIDRPQVVTQHDVLTRVRAGELTSQTALDVVENGVGVDPFGGRDAFMVRLLQGVADTNAEALAMPGVGDSVANAFDAPDDATDVPQWTVLLPTDAARVPALGLAPAIAARLAADLNAGQAVVLPPAAADVAKHGWWRVDPGTGTTLGIGNLGWGQDLVEYAFKLTIQLMMAQIGCMAFQAAAEPKVRGLSAEEGRDKIQQWFKGCVSQALLETVAGISTAWIHSHFLEGAKVPRWDKRAQTSKTKPFNLPPQAMPHGPGPEEGPHTPPRKTPPHEETPPTPPTRTTPPHEDAPPTARPPTEGNNGPRPTPQTEEGNTGPRTTPPTEEGNTGPRPTPQTEEGGNTGARKTPPTEEESGPTRKPPAEDDSLDGKTLLDPNCLAEAYEVRVAMLEVEPSPIRSDASPAPLLVAANCPTPRPPGGTSNPRPEDQPKVVQQIEEQTKAAQDARQEAVNAAKKYYDDPTSENQEAYRRAEQAEQAARGAEDDAWWQAGGVGPSPATANKQPMPTPPEGWDPANPRPAGGTTGTPEPEAPPPSNSDGPIATGGPTPGPDGSPKSSPPNIEEPPVQPNKTQPMDEASPRPTGEPEGDIGSAKTQQAEPVPTNKTQPMEGAPQRPAGEPEGGAPRVSTGNDDPLAATQNASPGKSADAIKAAADADTAAAKRLDDAYGAFDKNPTPENAAAARQAEAESSAATKAARDAWGEGTPEQRSAALGKYTEERLAAQRAFNDAEQAYKANPTADTLEAAQAAQDNVNAARRAEMSAAGSAGSHIPDGTPPAPTPLPPVEPMAIPPEQEGPPTPRPQEEPQGAAPAASPKAGTLGDQPQRPLGPPAENADGIKPIAGEPEGGAPRASTGNDGALADTQAASPLNKTQPMEGAPQRPAGEPEGGTPRVSTGNDDPLAATQNASPGKSADAIKAAAD